MKFGAGRGSWYQRVQHPRYVRKRDVSDAGAVEFKGAKGPLDAYSWVDKMERAFESTELPEEKKVRMTVSFLDDSAHHWWTLARRNNDSAEIMTWEKFKALFLDDDGVIEFEQRFTTLSYHVPYLVPDERTKIDMFIGALGGVFAGKMVGVIYPTLLDAVGAAMTIETRGTFSARPRDFSGPSQGPSKKAASSSASGSLAGSGSSGGSGSGPRSRFRGGFRRPSKS
ncbi:hypothetical protein ACLB2K_062348 [Fragaria x ananassa]